MPKRPSLEPVKDGSRWRLNIPPTYSPDGKRQRVWVRTRKAAVGYAERLQERSKRFGALGRGIDASDIADATEAIALLRKHVPGASLKTAALEFIDHHNQRNASVTLSRLLDEFTAAKAHRSDAYRYQLRFHRRRFARLGEVLVRDLTPADIESCLAGVPPMMRNALLRYLRAALNLGIRRGWLEKNLVARLDFHESKRREVETFTVPQVRSLLTAASERFPDLAIFLILGFFCGIRPAEILRLNWEDIHDGAVTIRPNVSKTRRRRFVDLSDNAKAWLEPYRRESGPVITVSADQLRNRRREVCQAAGVDWIKNGPRHSFCSMWLAMHGDTGRLVLMSGHDSVDTMWRNYHRGVKKAEAERFWSIFPASAPSNVIRISA
jgi:integrase